MIKVKQARQDLLAVPFNQVPLFRSDLMATPVDCALLANRGQILCEELQLASCNSKGSQ